MEKHFMNKYPRIGLGTWEINDREVCAETVARAIEIGYRHIDTAQFYKNEEYVGEGIAKSKVNREDLFVATKIWVDNLSRDKVMKTTEQSLHRLGLDYIDCLYVHWPAKTYEPQETLQAFEKLQEEGTIKHIGVSNFTVELLEQARDIMKKPIFANQVEMHPLNQQKKLRNYQIKNDIKLVAYSPFRHGTLFDNQDLQKIADGYECSVARLSLAWLLSKENVLPVPKARGKKHLVDNFKALELKLKAEDIERIDALDEENRFIDPPFAAWNN